MTELNVTLAVKRCINPECPVDGDQPLSEFYVRSGIEVPTLPGHYLGECKTCMKRRSRERQPLLSDQESRVRTENLTISKLKELGIWAQPGKACSAPDVDVAAWGCVWIEVKHARLEPHGNAKEFTFVMTPKQVKRGFLADLVMLICEWLPETYSYHLFRYDDPVFYIKGRLKTGFTYRPGRTQALKHGLNRVVMTSGMMEEARDRWGLIEDVRCEHAQKLPNEPFPHRRWRE